MTDRAHRVYDAAVALATTRGRKLPRDVALAYAEHGVPVFPANRQNKRPIIAGGHNAASTDPATVRAWWRDHPRAAVAIPTGSGLTVLDEDREGALAEWLGGEPPATFQVRTPSGGRHLLYAGDSRCTARDGLDVKGSGGYVLAPLALSVSGLYRPVSDAPPAPLPSKPEVQAGPLVYTGEPDLDRLPGMVAPPDTEALDRLDGACTAIMEAEPGGRHHALYRHAYRVGIDVGRGWIGAQQAARMLLTAAEPHARGDDPKPLHEQERQITRGLWYGAHDKRSLPHPDVAAVNRRCSIERYASGTVFVRDHAAGKRVLVQRAGSDPHPPKLERLPAFKGARVHYGDRTYSLASFWWNAPRRRDKSPVPDGPA